MSKRPVKPAIVSQVVNALRETGTSVSIESEQRLSTELRRLSVSSLRTLSTLVGVETTPTTVTATETVTTSTRAFGSH